MKHLKKSRSLGGHLEYATIDSIPRQRQTSNQGEKSKYFGEHLEYETLDFKYATQSNMKFVHKINNIKYVKLNVKYVTMDIEHE